MEPTATTALRPSPPPGTGYDLDPSRRPGVPREREPKPWPNTRFPPARQQGEPSVPMHGRPGKTMPPVFGTAVPLRGLSGTIRKAAYGYPDHYLRHWMMLIAADRVDSAGSTFRRLLRAAAPGLVAAAGLGVLNFRRARRTAPARQRPAPWPKWARNAWGTA
jgi:hypothetical protein